MIIYWAKSLLQYVIPNNCSEGLIVFSDSFPLQILLKIKKKFVEFTKTSIYVRFI